MSKCIRIDTDTVKQLAINVPIRIMDARLVSIADDVTTANIYDEVKGISVTPAKKVIALANTTTKLSDETDLPEDGILFTEGCYVDWDKGEVFLYIKE